MLCPAIQLPQQLLGTCTHHEKARTLDVLGSEGNKDFSGASLAATSSACEVCPFVGFAIGFVTGAGGAVTALLTAEKIARIRPTVLCYESTAHPRRHC